MIQNDQPFIAYWAESDKAGEIIPVSSALTSLQQRKLPGKCYRRLPHYICLEIVYILVIYLYDCMNSEYNVW